MRKTLLVALLLLPVTANAQSFAHGDENWPPPPGPWSNTAALALNITQSAFSDNWSGGDTGSISWQLKGDFGARRQVSQSFHWANQLQLAFGQTANQIADPNDPGSKVWASPVKSTDQILAESVGILTKGWAVDPYGSVRFDSQFIDATDPRRRWLNPMTFTESIGVAKTIAAAGEDRNSLFRLGFALRQNVARNFVDAVTEDTETTTSQQGGIQLANDTTWKILEDRVLYTGKLLVFYPLFFADSDKLEELDTALLAADPTRESIKDFWKSPNVDWQNTFSSNITDWLAVNLYLRFKYLKFDTSTPINLDAPATEAATTIDGGIRKAGQLQETLGVGLTYRFL